jgi:predicted esterase
MSRRLAASTLVFMIACSESGSPDAGDGSSGQGTTSGASGETTGVTSTLPATTTSGQGTDAEEDTGSESSTSGEPGPPSMPTVLPAPTGTCPTLADGEVMFAPAGIEPRGVRLWMSDAAAAMDGPLVFYWHGTGSAPEEAPYGLGADLVAEVVAQGGIIAAPVHDPAAGDFPWFLVLGSREDDLLLADEVLACAIEQVGVDVTHIHTAGMSAGGLMTSQMSFRRSGYIASAVPYSGGIIATPPDQEPSNPLSAMIFHGGQDDQVILKFQQTSELYRAAIDERGGFAYLCDHGMGHSIPLGSVQASMWQFFRDHPYGTKPSPYKDGLPQGFPEYCALP